MSQHRRPQTRRIAALLASFGLAAVGVIAAPALRLVPGPVDVVAREVAVDLTAATERVVELPIAASHVSAHWQGGADAHVAIQVAATPGAWSEVIPLDADDPGFGGHGRDEDVASPGDDTSYSDVIWADHARFVRLTSDRPIGTVTVVAYQADGPPRMVVAADAPVAEAAVGAPTILTRAQWGANEDYRFDYAHHESWPPSYYPLQVLVVHHTAGRNNDPNPAATIRAIYYDDAVLRGWGDMGYNFLIDAAGHVYEGRHARDYASGERHDGEDLAGNVARGAHAKGFNSGTMGIVLLGTFDTVQPTSAARNALEKLLAWEAERHGINPTTASTYTNPDLGTSKYLNHISGHRNVGNTDCPGSLFYSTFPALRTAVASRIAATLGPVADPTPPTVASFTSLASEPTGGASIDFGLRFSEAVTGLTADDISVGGTSTGWSVTGVRGIGAGYTVTVSNTPPPDSPIPEGTIELQLAADAVTDGGTNTGPANPAAATATFATDTTAPTVTLTYTPRWNATRATIINVAITFSEPVAALTEADIQVGGTSDAKTPWTVDPVVGSGAHYGFSIENASPADGTLSIGIPAGATTDPAGNPSEASTTHTVAIDRTVPRAYPPTTRLRSGVSLTTLVPATVSWTGTDWSTGSGIAYYDVARSIDGGAFAVYKTGVTGTSLGVWQSSGHAFRYEVRAHDRAGNVSGWAAGSTIRATLLQQTSSAIAWHGTWTTVSSSSYSGGSLRYTTVAGATASLTTSARGLAFVTTRGPSRGAVKVYVDGVLKATIDLYSPTWQYRYVAYVATWSTLGTHRLTVMNVATPGRTRIDLDGFEFTR